MCIILLVGILIATILILTILVRNLLRDLKNDIVKEIRKELISVSEGLRKHNSTEVLKELKDIKEKDLTHLGRKIFELNEMLYEIGDEIFKHRHHIVGEGGPNSSNMMGHYMTGHGQMTQGMATGFAPSTMSRDPGHSIHVFRSGRWELQEDFSKAGYEASKPSMKGNYEGQVVRTISGSGPEDGS